MTDRQTTHFRTWYEATCRTCEHHVQGSIRGAIDERDMPCPRCDGSMEVTLTPDPAHQGEDET